jgi:hypothetical protein
MVRRHVKPDPDLLDNNACADFDYGLVRCNSVQVGLVSEVSFCMATATMYPRTRSEKLQEVAATESSKSTATLRWRPSSR